MKTKKINYIKLLSWLLVLTPGINSFSQDNPRIASLNGGEEFRHTNYITAGDRLYAIGAQNGTFPEIGWHIKDEMGGIWYHPIKLMDGFSLTIQSQNIRKTLNEAQFINHPIGNSFYYEEPSLGLKIKRFQFSPDQHQGLIVEYTLNNESSKTFNGNIEFKGYFDLRPTWLSERKNIVDGADKILFNQKENILYAQDPANPWFAAITCSEKIKEFEPIQSNYQGNGKAGKLTIPVIIKGKSEKTIRFFIAGSYQNKKELIEELNKIINHHQDLLSLKIQRYKEIDETAKLSTSDQKFNEIFRWLKFNSEGFIRDVPEFGRGIAAGFPDYPWWFGCDSEYALKGYLAIGNHSLVESTIQLLYQLSLKTNSNGRIVHEVSTNGEVYNPGNINETPQFVSLVWEAYLWTGKKELLYQYFDYLVKGMNWVLNENDANKNGIPEGSGMMEIHGLNSEMIDVATYTQKALDDLSKMARVLNKKELENEFKEKANQLKNKINTTFWVEDFRSYADFLAKDSQAMQLIQDAIIRADTLKKPWAVEELEKTKNYLISHPSDSIRPFVLYHNWVVNTPMEMGIAEGEKAKKALETGRKFVNPYGVFVTGIDRDESAGKALGSFKGTKAFSYTGAVMTLPTGVAAVGENNYGNADQSLDYLKRMGNSFSFALPGSIYEVSPDYGMFTQAWNLYSFAVPTIQQFFGIKPNAAEKSVLITPNMPSDWTFANLENIQIGKNKLSIFYQKTESEIWIKIESLEKGWDIRVVSPKTSLPVKIIKE